MHTDPTPLLDATGEPLRLMAVHAHPDDESSKGAATMARAVAEGAAVMVVTCTGGERGDILNPRLDTPENWAGIRELRRSEMDEASRILGVQHRWLGYEDSGLPQGDPLPPLPPGCFALIDPDEAGARLAALIREFRPHVLLTYDENGGYPHPDHIQTHVVSLRAIDLAADPGADIPGEPWAVAKVYYHMTFHRQRAVALDRAMHEDGLASPYREWLEDWPEDPSQASRLTTFVPCAEYFPVRDEALRAHATQVDPDGFWFAVPLPIQQRAWPTEDYQLVRTRVPVRLPEEDLFAGLVGVDVARLGSWLSSI